MTTTFEPTPLSDALDRVSRYARKSASGQGSLFDESKHPRGQPENAGEFVKSGGSASTPSTTVDVKKPKDEDVSAGSTVKPVSETKEVQPIRSQDEKVGSIAMSALESGKKKIMPNANSRRGYLDAGELTEDEATALIGAGLVTPQKKRGAIRHIVDTDAAIRHGLRLPGEGEGPLPVPTNPIGRLEAGSIIESHLNHAGFSASVWTPDYGNAVRVYVNDKNGKNGHIDIGHDGQISDTLNRQRGAILSAIPDLAIIPVAPQRISRPDESPDDPLERMEWEHQRNFVEGERNG